MHGLDGLTDYYDMELKKRRHAMLLQNQNFSCSVSILEDHSKLDNIIDEFQPNVIIHLTGQASMRYSISGMIPWLLIAEPVSRSGRSLGDCMKDRFAAFPNSGEINFKVADAAKANVKVLLPCRADALSVDETDGVSLELDDWRCNCAPLKYRASHGLEC